MDGILAAILLIAIFAAGGLAAYAVITGLLVVFFK